ncbi:MAG: hypothetical protein K0A95_07585 [Chromatiales bacterium]|nr:hypothetical protein [Chromatiales bacterium]
MDTATTPVWQTWLALGLHDGLGWLLLLIVLLALPVLRITSQRQTLLNTLGVFHLYPARSIARGRDATCRT